MGVTLRRGWIVLAGSLAVVLTACTGDKSPTEASAGPSRILSLSGSLDFGAVAVGQNAERTLTITNTGNSTLTVSGVSVPTGFVSTWTGGTITAGASQPATIRFMPTAAQGYSGSVVISGDQTSGANSIAVSGTGVAPPNRPPVVGSIDVFPQGMGITSVTRFRFFGRNFGDPDGDPLAFAWQFGDGASSSDLEPTHVYDSSNNFETRLTVRDPGGLSSSTSVSVSTGTLSGVWDLSCNRTTYAIQSCVGFPSGFVVTLSQNGTVLTGTLSGGGKTKNFTFPGSVSDPRSAFFGVESGDNTFCGPNFDNDMYFRMAASDNLRSMSSSQGNQYCSAYSATKR